MTKLYTEIMTTECPIEFARYIVQRSGNPYEQLFIGHYELSRDEEGEECIVVGWGDLTSMWTMRLYGSSIAEADQYVESRREREEHDRKLALRRARKTSFEIIGAMIFIPLMLWFVLR